MAGEPSARPARRGRAPASGASPVTQVRALQPAPRGGPAHPEPRAPFSGRGLPRPGLEPGCGLPREAPAGPLPRRTGLPRRRRRPERNAKPRAAGAQRESGGRGRQARPRPPRHRAPPPWRRAQRPPRAQPPARAHQAAAAAVAGRRRGPPWRGAAGTRRTGVWAGGRERGVHLWRAPAAAAPAPTRPRCRRRLSRERRRARPPRDRQVSRERASTLATVSPLHLALQASLGRHVTPPGT